MTEQLITDLSKIRALRVISRTSIMRYRGTRKPLSEIANELGVDVLVVGSVMRSADKVRIAAQLIEARGDQNLWAESYDRQMSEVLALQREVARNIANEIRITMTPAEQAQLASDRRVDPEVHQLVLRGQYFANKGTEASLKQALGYFEQALAKDPNYAPAHSGAAFVYGSGNSSCGSPGGHAESQIGGGTSSATGRDAGGSAHYSGFCIAELRVGLAGGREASETSAGAQSLLSGCSSAVRQLLRGPGTVHGGARRNSRGPEARPLIGARPSESPVQPCWEHACSTKLSSNPAGLSSGSRMSLSPMWRGHWPTAKKANSRGLARPALERVRESLLIIDEIHSLLAGNIPGAKNPSERGSISRQRFQGFRW